MNTATTRVDAGAEARSERLQRWIAALCSALVHLLLLLMLLFASKPTVTRPQGAASGSRMKVDFLGQTRVPVQIPSPTPPQAPAPARQARAVSPVRTTLVQHADNPLPPPDPTPAPGAVAEPQPQPEQRSAQTPASSPPTPRRPETWTGHPPGMRPTDVADADTGMADGPEAEAGDQHDYNAAEPSMEVGGYQVYYDQRSETLLRTWKAQGMKEIAIPLPGTQYRMVCALEIALRRGSGKCRLLEPSSPQMQAIGDGREVINMIQVYRRGEVVWRGPGPYR